MIPFRYLQLLFVTDEDALTGGTLWVLGLVFDNAGDMRWASVYAILSTLDR